MGVLARPKAISVAPTLNLIPRVGAALGGVGVALLRSLSKNGEFDVALAGKFSSTTLEFGAEFLRFWGAARESCDGIFELCAAQTF